VSSTKAVDLTRAISLLVVRLDIIQTSKGQPEPGQVMLALCPLTAQSCTFIFLCLGLQLCGHMTPALLYPSTTPFSSLLLPQTSLLFPSSPPCFYCCPRLQVCRQDEPRYTSQSLQVWYQKLPERSITDKGYYG
jgi:hypothetical protein